MHRKFLFYFILLSLLCFSTFAVSAQIEITFHGPLNPNDMPVNTHIEGPTYMGFEYEKERLDLTAKVWGFNTDQDILLIIWDGEEGEKSQADELGEKSGRYLVDTHKIPEKKIMIVVVHQIRVRTEMRIYLNNSEDENKNWFEKLSKIKVGVSTKRDFEKTFPPYDFETTQTLDSKTKINYETYEGDASVVYSNGKCSELPEIIPSCVNKRVYVGGIQ